MYNFTTIYLLPALLVSWIAGCIENTSSVGLSNSQSFKMPSCSAQAPLLRIKIQGNVRRLNLTARCQKETHPNISDLAADLGQEIRSTLDQIDPSCVKEVITDLANNDKEFGTLCLANGVDNKSLSPAIRSETLKSCADRATDMIAGKPSGRSQLTLKEAEKLAKNAKIAYHVTRLRHVKSIMLTGLDPKFGANEGLCDVYLGSGMVANLDVYKKYKESSLGYVHLVSDVKDVPQIVGLYNLAFTGVSILAVRLSEDMMPLEQDPYFGVSSFKTRSFIPKEDIVAIPESDYKKFKIEKPENFMQQPKQDFVSFCKNALNGLFGRH